MSKNKGVTIPLKVIHSSPIWLPQTQTWIYNQFRHLPKDQIETHVVCDQTENLDQFNVPNIHSLSGKSKLRFFWDIGLRKFRLKNHSGLLTQVAKEIGANIIHSHFGHRGWANIAAANKINTKHVVTFYGHDVNMLPQDPLWKKRYRQLFAHADLFLCEGHCMAQTLNLLGCPENKIKVHHLGIEIEKIAYQPRKWSNAQPFRILIAARFREKKGIPYALEALGAIKNEIDLEITIIGDASADPSSQKEKDCILRTIDKVGLKNRTRMLGYQPHARLFTEAYKHHLFLSPSVAASDGDTEGGAPVSLIEMMATGIPVISTTHCDIPEVVNYENKDWLVEERDVEALIKRIRWVCLHPENWETMLDIGRNHIATNYNAEIQGKKLAEIYKSCR